jgi:hypothetical protein
MKPSGPALLPPALQEAQHIAMMIGVLLRTIADLPTMIGVLLRTIADLPTMIGVLLCTIADLPTMIGVVLRTIADLPMMIGVGLHTSGGNFEPIPVCRSQLAKWLWHRFGTVAKARPLLPSIQHQEPPTTAVVAQFVQANRDSKNQCVLDIKGNRLPPPYRHHVDDCLCGDIGRYLERTVCASALALYELLGFPSDTRQIGALSMEKLDTMCRPTRKMVGYAVNGRNMTVALLQYKRDQTVETATPWLTMPVFTLLQADILCGQLKSTSKCNRWIRPYFFSMQNTIRAALIEKWKKVQGFYKRNGTEATKAKCNLPKHLERRLIPLIARDKALLLWHSKSTFPVLAHVQKDIALMIDWLRDPAVLWEKSVAHWIPRDPTFVSAGDASQVAGGAITEELKFWFDVYWTERVRRGCKLPPSDPDFIHINALEFVVVLIQLAACITALETDCAKSICGDTLPQIPHLWVWTDNESSKSWANRLTTAVRNQEPTIPPGSLTHGWMVYWAQGLNLKGIS